MAANTRGAIRPNGRSPPFLAIGLTVALVILGFNYWSLSARNGEQSNEIAVLESEMRLMNAKKISAEKRSEAISDKVKELEDELSKQKAVIADKMAQMTNMNAEKDVIMTEKQKFEDEANACNNEKLPTCSKEKEDLQLQLNEVKEALDNEKNNPRETICDEGKCSNFSQASRQKLLDDIKRVLGAGPLVNMYQNGIDLGVYGPEIQQLAAQAQNAGQPIVGAPQNFIPRQPPQQPQQPLLPGQPGLFPQAVNPAVPNQPEQPSQDQQPDAAALEQKVADQNAQGARPPQDLGAEQDSNLPQVPNPNDGIVDQQGAQPALNEENKAEGDNKNDIGPLDADAPDNDQDMGDEGDYDEDEGDDQDNPDGDFDDNQDDEGDDTLKVMPNDKDDVGDDDYADEDDNDYDNDWLRPDEDELDDIAAQDKNIDEMQAQLERDAQQ